MQVRYNIDPVPDTSVSSVRDQPGTATHRDVIPWSFRSTHPRTQRHTPHSPVQQPCKHLPVVRSLYRETRRPLTSVPLTQTRPMKSTYNQFQQSEVGTTVTDRVSSVHIPPVYTTSITGRGHFVMLGTTSIPVPDTSVSSVRHQNRSRTLG